MKNLLLTTLIFFDWMILILATMSIVFLFSSCSALNKHCYTNLFTNIPFTTVVFNQCTGEIEEVVFEKIEKYTEDYINKKSSKVIR